MPELEIEKATYDRHKEDFHRDHKLEWVVIHGDQVVGFFGEFQQAAETAVERFGRGPYLIRQIGAPIEPLPASLLYHPTTRAVG